MKKRIAIIGAGVSGLTLAHELKNIADVKVFEKARGVGGRMASRYADLYSFDHGTQYFTARSKAFKKFLRPFIDQGIIVEWKGKVITCEVGKKTTDRLWFEPHYVALPNMNGLCKKLAEDLEILTSIEVAPLSYKSAQGWHVRDKNDVELGVFDLVISTAPAAQTNILLHKYIEGHHLPKLQGCYALMIGFNKPWDRPWIAAKVHDNPISWISVNSSKPGRNNAVTSLVIHSTNSWAEEHMDDAAENVEAELKSQLKILTEIDANQADYTSLHRWRYAILGEGGENEPYLDAEYGIAYCGDWCSYSRIEDAWKNAQLLVGKLKKIL